MEPRELEILEAIEAEFAQNDAAFAARLTAGPSLPLAHRIRFALALLLGVSLVLLFPVNLSFAIAGYVVLVAAGTEMMRHHRFTPAEESPLETFHRFTAGLFRSTDDQAEISD
jgi:Protein of unknown function (DUF3040)